jgi:hypothetical protein
MMFTRFQEYIKPYDDEFTVEEICEAVLRDIDQQGESASRKKVIETLGGYYNTYMYQTVRKKTWFDFRPTKSDNEADNKFLDREREFWEKERKYAREFEKKEASQFLARNKGTFILCTTYSDNEGSFGAAMEHGDIFRNLDHIRVSEH